MGGNNSYSKGWGGVPEVYRTHKDTGYRINGHKVVFFTDNPRQRKNILNSNSEDATYLIATKEKDNTLKVQSVNVIEGHHLAYEINIEFDKQGDLIPFDGKSKGTHAHHWQKDPETGRLKRKSHDKKNTFAVSKEYTDLVENIATFNKEKKKYEKK